MEDETGAAFWMNGWWIYLIISGYRSVSVEFGSSKKKILSHKFTSNTRKVDATEYELLGCDASSRIIFKNIFW